MSGIWYITAIAATAGALLSTATTVGLSFPLASVTRTPADQLERIEQVKRAKIKAVKTEAASKAVEKDKVTGSDYQQAMDVANQAVIAYQAAKDEADPASRSALIRRERFLWQVAIGKLANVPEQDSQYEQANLKRTQYKGLLANAEKSLAQTESALLKSIVESTDVDASAVHLTVCQLDGSGANGQLINSVASQISQFSEYLEDINRCHHHQGDVPMASPASLIKLPIAIAAMDKATQAHASLDAALSDKIYIDPSNFTENAEGASVDIDQEYTLEQVVTRMLNESNNIATNQLIDYVGRAGIAKTLKIRGYDDTLVDHKLAGDRILPPNPGNQSNQATSNDITAMLASIYSLENPGDEILLTALRTQRDQELGYQALQEISSETSSNFEWLGEKTGQNDRLIGTTLAMRVGMQRYTLTVGIDYSGDPQAVRDIIQAVAQHLQAAELAL
ncbi:MAG: serine hydrolase [Cyanobacteria bacterium J06634_6]